MSFTNVRSAVVALCLLSPLSEISAQGLRRVDNVEVLAQTSIPTGTQFAGTEFGGISGLAYDRRNARYLGLSDDRSQLAPARYYGLDIAYANGALNVAIASVTTLRDASGQPFPALSVDPEGLALLQNGRLFVSSEGDANALIAPFVRLFGRDGGELRALPVPQDYLPVAGGASGIRNNLAFESLTLTPNERLLYTATENALFQDGPAASLTQGSLCRVLQYHAHSGRVRREFVYETDPIVDAPVPANGFATNGLVELLALDDFGTFLALERSFSVGVGNDVRLYEIRYPFAWLPFGFGPAVPPTKRLLVDFGAQGIVPDNLEAMAFGPRLADGRELLIVAADNNFSPTQASQFVALAVRFRRHGV